MFNSYMGGLNAVTPSAAAVTAMLVIRYKRDCDKFRAQSFLLIRAVTYYYL